MKPTIKYMLTLLVFSISFFALEKTMAQDDKFIDYDYVKYMFDKMMEQFWHDLPKIIGIFIVLTAFNIFFEAALIKYSFQIKYSKAITIMILANLLSLFGGISILTIAIIAIPYYFGIWMDIILYFASTVVIEEFVIWIWSKRLNIVLSHLRIVITILLANTITFAVSVPLLF